MDIRIIKALDKMTDNLEKNYKIITKKISVNPDIARYRLLNGTYNNKKVLLAIESLLKYGIDPTKEYDGGNNFISIILNKNLSEELYCQILELAIKYGHDINYKNTKNNNNLLLNIFNEYNYTYYANEYRINTKFTKIMPLYNILVNNGFDIFVTDNNYNTIGEAFKNYTKNNEVIDKDEFIIQYNKDRINKMEKKKDELVASIKENNPNYNKSNFNNIVLHRWMEAQYDEELIIKVVEQLLKDGLNPNILNAINGNFIFVSIINRHSIDFIYKITEIAIKYGLDVNHVDQFNDTIIDYLIDNHYNHGVILVLKLLLANGFDINKVNHLNSNNNAYKEILGEINAVKNAINNPFITLGLDSNEEKEINNNELNNIEKYFDFKDIYNNSCLNLLIFKEGIDKEAYLYTLKQALVNKYNEKILIISADKIIKECNFIGEYKNKLVSILNDAVKNNVFIFIDDLDKLYCSKNDIEKQIIDIILEHFIEKTTLKILATVNINKKELFTNGNLKKLVKEIEVEPIGEINLEEKNYKSNNIKKRVL